MFIKNSIFCLEKQLPAVKKFRSDLIDRALVLILLIRLVPNYFVFIPSFFRQGIFSGNSCIASMRACT